MQRTTVFAGQFYPSNKKTLAENIDKYLANAKKEIGKSQKEKTNIVIAPHAGYIYSGQTAAYSFSVLEKAKTFIILSPNHTGIGREISIYPSGEWLTPLGKIKINNTLSKKIAEAMETETDETAHIGEHSIEVQLPFLQELFGSKEFEIVAITLATQSLEKLKKLAKAIAELTEKESVSIIASSDFTHFESLDSARQKDTAAIKLIEKLNVEAFFEKVEQEQLSICGYETITTAMEIARKKGKKTARLLHYDSSASASKDTTSVVGYAAIALF
jgi:AmmeMemoRadiSam system protein B